MFLFATIHVRDPAAVPTEAVLTRALKQASALYLETTEPARPARATLGAFRTAFAWKRDPAYAAMSSRKHAALRTLLQQIDFPPFLSFRFAPAALTTMLFELREFGGPDTHPSLEEHFAAVARRHQVPVEGLATVDSGHAMIKDMPHDAKVSLLETSIDEPQGQETYAALRRAWMNADQAGLQAYVDDWEACYTPYGRYEYQVMIRARTAQFADRLAMLLRTQDGVFVALAVNHLLGKGGLVERLGHGGLQVQRVY